MRSFVTSADYNRLGREEFFNNMYNNLISIKTNRHICLNGGWGTGKTTLVFDLINRIEPDCLEEDTYSDDKVKGNQCLYFDAWKYENFNSPVIALIKAMQESKPKMFKLFQSLYKKKFRVSFGIDLKFINIHAEKQDEEVFFDELNYETDLEGILMTLFSEYIEIGKTNLYIFVDELDRCKPDFAMRLLERFHHFKSRDDIVFVYSVDMKQFKGMVKHYYGFEYNHRIFFQKLFDVEIRVPQIGYEDFKKIIGDRLHEPRLRRRVEDIIMKNINYKDVSLRNLNFIMKKINYFFESPTLDYLVNSIGWIPNPLIGKVYSYYDLVILLIIHHELEFKDIRSFLANKKVDFILEFLTPEHLPSFTDLVLFQARKVANDNEKELPEKLVIENIDDDIKILAVSDLIDSMLSNDRFSALLYEMF